jgi:L-ascorbate metabolism protein UlaG (beta-lactamase superfamily)
MPRLPSRSWCQALFVAAVSGLQSPLAGQLTVEYLANEGVLLAHGQTTVAIDAFFGDGLPGYPTVPRATRDSLERARGRFGEIDLVLVTHQHADHFSAAALARHLRANPGAHLAAAPAIVAALRAAGWTDPARTAVVLPSPSERRVLTAGGVGLEAIGLEHAGIDHLAWVVSLGGVRTLHAGDADPSPGDLRLAAGEGVDLFLTPFWIALGRRGPERLAATRARQVAAFHVGHSDDVTGLPSSFRVLRRPGETFTVERSGP